MTRPTFTARTPVDLIALAPLVLGFHPEDSIVLLTFGGATGQFHARIDLPMTPEDRAPVVGALARPVAQHGVTRAAVLIYSEDAELARSVAADLAPALEHAGARLIDVLRVDDECYHHLLEADLPPVPYDISTHAFAAEAVYLGRQTLPSRADLADQLVGGSPDEVERVREAAMASAGLRPDRVTDARWIQHLVRSWLRDRRPVEAADAGTLLLLLSDRDLRDVAWAELTPETSALLQDLWIDLLRRCPEELVPAPAALLAFAAWLDGQGAMAWCAVDRCLGIDPDYSMGHLLSRMLEDAVPPRVWRPISESELTVFADPRGGDVRDRAS